MHHWFCFLFYRNSCFMCSKAVMSWIFWFPFFITWTMLDLTSVRMPLSSFYHIYDSHANYIKSAPHFPDRPAVPCIYNVHNVKKTTGTYWFFATVNSFFSGLFKNLILLSSSFVSMVFFLFLKHAIVIFKKDSLQRFLVVGSTELLTQRHTKSYSSCDVGSIELLIHRVTSWHVKRVSGCKTHRTLFCFERVWKTKVSSLIR